VKFAFFPRLFWALIFLPPLGAVFWVLGHSFFLKWGWDLFFLKAFLNTFYLSLITAFVCFIISFPLALLLTKTPFPWKRAAVLLLTTPLLFLPYQTALAWSFILPPALLSLLFSFWGVVFIFSLSFFPLIFWPLYLAFLAVPAEAEESALLLYPPLKVFQKITLPYVKPYLLGGIGLCIFFSFAEISAPTYLGVPVIGSEILTRFAAFYDIDGALRASFPLAILGLIFFILEKPLLSRWEIPISFEEEKGLCFGNKWFVLLGSIWLLIVLLGAVFLPLFLLLEKAQAVDLGGAISKIKLPLWRSLFYGLLVSLVSVSLAFLAQPLLTLKEKRVWEGLGLFLFFLPPVILAVGLIFFWSHFSLVYTSSLLLLLGLWGRFTFLPQRLLGEVWKRFNKHALEAAYLSGRPFYLILLKIIFPSFRPWLGLAMILFFIFSVNEITLSSLLYPPGGAPLAVAIYTLSVNTPLSFSAFLCLLNTTMILVVISVFFFIFRPKPWKK